MSKFVEYHTIEIRIPKNMLNTSKNGHVSVVPTLTKTGNPSKRAGKSSIILKVSDDNKPHILEDGNLITKDELKENGKKKVKKEKTDTMIKKLHEDHSNMTSKLKLIDFDEIKKKKAIKLLAKPEPPKQEPPKPQFEEEKGYNPRRLRHRGASSPESWNWPDKYYTTTYEINDLKKEYEELRSKIILDNKNGLKYNFKEGKRQNDIEHKIRDNYKYQNSIDRLHNNFLLREEKRKVKREAKI